MADRSKPPKGLLVTGLVLLVLSFMGCGFGGATLAESNVVGFVEDLAEAVQGTNSTPLGTLTTVSASGDTAVILTSSDSASCEVSDSAGDNVVLAEPRLGTSGTVETTDGTSLDFRYSFDTDPSGTYEVICRDDLVGSSGEYVVVPFPGFGEFAGIFYGFGIGFLLFVVGLVLLIVGLVQRSKWNKYNSSGPPPRGGYSPSDPGQPLGGVTTSPPAAGYTPPPMAPPGQSAPRPTPPPMPPVPPPGNTPPPFGG